MSVGGWIAFAGVVLVLVGLLVMSGALDWFGRLPGDVRIERPSFRFYFPIVSMLIVSVVLSILWRLMQRFL